MITKSCKVNSLKLYAVLILRIYIYIYIYMTIIHYFRNNWYLAGL
jgi:hypothetical protein